MRLLVVEDEPGLRRNLLRGLREEGYAVDGADLLSTARDLAIANQYDVVLLDLMLPDGSGLDLLETWRSEGWTTPVLVLTARDTVRDKVDGLDQGADDYLTKPFDFEELLARIRSLSRRREAAPSMEYVFEELRFDAAARTGWAAGQSLDLTAKELALFELFVSHPLRVFTRSEIADRAWDESWTAESNVIDVLIGRLRRKIEDAGGRRLIQTVKGLGYTLREPDAEAEET